LTTYTGTQEEVIFSSGFAYPTCNASSSGSQLLCAGATGEYQQPVLWGGFWQMGRSNQVATCWFAITLSGQGSTTTATIGAGLNTAPNNGSGSTLLTFPAFACTSFSSGTVLGYFKIANWGTGYGTSSVATNLQSAGLITYAGNSTTGVIPAGITQLATTDFSVNQWLYLTITFSTASTSNSAILKQFIVEGNN
jgi:hypothetical protein